ncbi:Asp-tRNA(Asn)/Glu-tRNA(Gln) amidotransferase subunit GatC [bacterium]|nr:MAG: Asp-tRNA(Asn)/Glu-tRNA(Gln) amidotransferase subunit GatC [bacterium]
MAITKNDVLHAADLARLALTAEETETYTIQLQRIIGHVEKLSSVDTAGIEPSWSDGSKNQSLRDDKATSSLSNETALKNAPQKEHGCFKVPQIIE